MNRIRAFFCTNASRGGGIRTHDLFVPNEARYQAAPHPAESHDSVSHGGRWKPNADVTPTTRVVPDAGG